MRKLVKICTYILLTLTWFSGLIVAKNVTITKFVGIIVFVIWLFYKLGEYAIINHETKIPRGNVKLFFLISLFLLLTLASLFVAENLFFSMQILRGLIMLFGMLIIFYDQFSTERDLKNTYRILTYSGIFLGAFAIIQYLTGISFSNVSNYGIVTIGNEPRVTGFFQDPNYASLNMVVVIPLAYYLFKNSKINIEKIFIGLGILTTIVAILLTYSRGGMLSLIIVIILIFLHEQHKFRKIIIGGIILITLFKYLPSENIFERFNTIINSLFVILNNLHFTRSVDPSIFTRYSLLQSGWNMFINNFFTGVGLGSFMFVSPNHQVAHNTYLSIAAELGFFGIFIFIGIIFLSLRNLHFAQKEFEDKNLKNIVQGCKIGLYAFLINALFLTAQYERIFWVLLAFSMISYSISLQANRVYNLNINTDTNIQIEAGR